MNIAGKTRLVTTNKAKSKLYPGGSAILVPSHDPVDLALDLIIVLSLTVGLQACFNVIVTFMMLNLC